MQLQSGQTIAGNLIWHTGNLNIADDNQNLYYKKQYKVFTTNAKPDVDKGEVINAASVNRPTINNELNVSGQTNFYPRVKFALGSDTAQINYNTSGDLNFTTSKGANITFPSVSGTVITTGNYPTWTDVGGEYFLVKNGNTEIRPNNQHFTTASQSHNILPFQNNGSSIGDTNRRFNYAWFNNLQSNMGNFTSLQSQHNTGRFITFTNASDMTSTNISGANNTTASDIILGYDDNNLSKTRNIILNKPLLSKTGSTIIDVDGKLDFNDLKNNNKVDKSGDTLTGQLLFDGVGSSNIEFKTDNRRTGQIKQSTSLSGQTYQNEIKFLNEGGIDFNVNNRLKTKIDGSGLSTKGEINQSYRLVIDRNEQNGAPYVYIKNSALDSQVVTSTDSYIGQIHFVTNNTGTDIIRSQFSSRLLGNNDVETEFGQRNSQNVYNHYLKVNQASEVGLGGINPTPGISLNIKGLARANSEINQNQNDYTLATTKWVRTVAIQEIDNLKNTISNSGVTTTQVTVSDKYRILSGTKNQTILFDNTHLKITNNQSGNLYYNNRLVYDQTTIPIQSTSTPGIVKLNNTVNSTATDEAATAAQNKVQYDTAVSANNNANTRVLRSGDTMTGELVAPQIKQTSRLYFVNQGTDKTKIGYIELNDNDTRIYNPVSDRYLQLKNTGELLYQNDPVILNQMVSESGTENIVKRDSAGDVTGRLFRSTFADQNAVSGAIAFRVNNTTDNYTRFCNSPDAVRTWLGLHASVTRAADWGEITNKQAQATRWPSFAEVTSKPNTLGGYGITDAVNISGAQTITGAKTFSQTINCFRIHINDNANPGENRLQIGDDAYLCDVDEGMTIGLRSIQDPNKGYLKIGKHKIGDPGNDFLDIESHIFVVKDVNANHFHSRNGAYITGNLDANDVNIRSDIRSKKNLKIIDNALSKVNKLNGYFYDLNINGTDIWYQQAGLIAQEVQKVLPSAVKVDNHTELLMLNYNQIIGLIVESIKELDNRTRKKSIFSRIISKIKGS